MAKTKTKTRKKTKANRTAFDTALANAKPKRERKAGPPKAFHDARMPAAGTVLESRPVGGKVVRVEICDGFVKPRSHRPDGERFQFRSYSSLSAVMREARGLASNGWWWFGLGELRDGELINMREEG